MIGKGLASMGANSRAACRCRRDAVRGNDKGESAVITARFGVFWKAVTALFPRPEPGIYTAQLDDRWVTVARLRR